MNKIFHMTGLRLQSTGVGSYSIPDFVVQAGNPDEATAQCRAIVMTGANPAHRWNLFGLCTEQGDDAGASFNYRELS